MLVQVSSSVTSNVFSEHASWLMNYLQVYIVEESLKDASRKGSEKVYHCWVLSHQTFERALKTRP